MSCIVLIKERINFTICELLLVIIVARAYGVTNPFEHLYNMPKRGYMYQATNAFYQRTHTHIYFASMRDHLRYLDGVKSMVTIELRLSQIYEH